MSNLYKVGRLTVVDWDGNEIYNAQMDSILDEKGIPVAPLSEEAKKLEGLNLKKYKIPTTQWSISANISIDLTGKWRKDCDHALDTRTFNLFNSNKFSDSFSINWEKMFELMFECNWCRFFDILW